MFVEDEITELKSKLTKDIKKEIIAFANTKGGKIYIGIDDNGNIIGVNNIKEDIEALSGMIREGIKSDLSIYVNILQEKINNKDIIIIDVSEAPNKPYYLADKGLKSSGVFLRTGNTSTPASEETIKKILLDTQSMTFETTIAINQNLRFGYLNNTFKKHNIILDENKLKTLKISNLNGLYTNLGLLLSDECPYTIKCAIFDGKTKVAFKDRKEFVGSILKQVDDVFEYLYMFNKIKGNIVGTKRIDKYDYPEYALREAVLNAVIHRSFDYNSSVLVSLFDDRIEIVSIGGLVKGLELKDLYNGVSAYRNPNLANIFYRLEYVESFGTGIIRILESYKGYYKKPQFNNTDNSFKVTLYNLNYEEKSLNINEDNYSVFTQEEKIIKYLNNNIRITRKNVEILLNIGSTRAKEILNNMIDSELIIAIGSGKNTYYTKK